jgi:hypothetical protein
MKKILYLLAATLCLFTMVSTSEASIAITVTSAIALATSEEGNEKVTDLYHEQDAHALVEMVDSGEAVLLETGTIIVMGTNADFHHGCVAVHVKGSSKTLYITPDGLTSSTNFDTIVRK